MRLRAFVLLVLFAASASGAAPPKSAPGSDHGPAFASAIDVAEGKTKDTTSIENTRNYVFRGKTIRLNREGTLGLTFDAEHMRVAGAWAGGYLANQRANKDMGPTVAGKMHFATEPGPGWARDGSFADPRNPKEGPLPADWAQYKGLYVHGDRVVLSYTVGDCPVLEMPGGSMQGQIPVFTRTFNLGPSSKPLALLVAEEPGNTRGASSGTSASLGLENGRLIATVVGAPEQANWRAADGRLELHLPALKEKIAFRIVIARTPGNASPLADEVQREPQDLTPLTKGGPAHWPEVLTTQSKPAADDQAYVVDEITAPLKNPWGATIRFGGLDFFPDGRAALCTWDGDVWVVSGLDDKLQNIQWKRFAAGLQHPLGLKIVNGVIHTAGRDQITRLHDLNGDGEADFYENLNSGAALTVQRHEFVMDLETDAAGNFYFCRSGHYIASKKGENCCVFKLSPDGGKLEVFARGFREANGMSIGPDGVMTVGDNEGNGVPQTPIYRLVEGGEYGYQPPPAGRGGGWKLKQSPILWLPKTADRSAGSQAWVPARPWGPLAPGHLLHTSYGNCRLFHIMLDRQGDTLQGFAWTFPAKFSSGIMRARFSPKDGQLYVAGLKGWDTNAIAEGQFARVRHTSKPARMPVAVKVTKTGLDITFTDPLDKAEAEDDQNWAGEWHDTAAPQGRKTKAKEQITITAAKLSPDARTVSLTLDRFAPVTNIQIEYQLKSADGADVQGTIYGTINTVPE